MSYPLIGARLRRELPEERGYEVMLAALLRHFRVSKLTSSPGSAAS